MINLIRKIYPPSIVKQNAIIGKRLAEVYPVNEINLAWIAYDFLREKFAGNKEEETKFMNEIYNHVSKLISNGKINGKNWKEELVETEQNLVQYIEKRNICFKSKTNKEFYDFISNLHTVYFDKKRA